MASLDRAGNLYFVSTRSYPQTLSTIYSGRFRNGAVSVLRLVPGISQHVPGMVNFDAEISADGNTLYFVDGLFTGGSVPAAADLAIARRRGAGFQRLPDSARLLAQINTPALEYAPATSADAWSSSSPASTPAIPAPSPRSTGPPAAVRRTRSVRPSAWTPSRASPRPPPSRPTAAPSTTTRWRTGGL